METVVAVTVVLMLLQHAVCVGGGKTMPSTTPFPASDLSSNDKAVADAPDSNFRVYGFGAGIILREACRRIACEVASSFCYTRNKCRKRPYAPNPARTPRAKTGNVISNSLMWFSMWKVFFGFTLNADSA